MKSVFKLQSNFRPQGDQPKAIEGLVCGVRDGLKHQTLLGATGTGKTFTIANVIQKIATPTLVIAHNKTLAAQLAQEYREFFPENAVHYFVSYYDYYQPEAYMPVTDTYIEKEAMINEEIERLRHASTQALLTRRDVIIVASVSCIYGLGSPEEYEKVHMKIRAGDTFVRADFLRRLIYIHYTRTNADVRPGQFRAIGNTVEIKPPNETFLYRVELEGNTIAHIVVVDAISRKILEEIATVFLFPAKHFITPEDERDRAVNDIKTELAAQLGKFKREGKVLEAERLKRRTNYDLALIREVGYCNGIENYSRHFDGREEGEAPYTLLSYFRKNRDLFGGGDFLTVIDESHVTVPQLNGMYAGDRARKETLVEHGFRLPSAKDNRPLQFHEFEERVGQRIYTSATPGQYEHEKSCSAENFGGSPSARFQESPRPEFNNCPAIVEQIIRPTGLVDPKVTTKPILPHLDLKGPNGGGGHPYGGQIVDFMDEAEKVIKEGGRVIATTLTKKMAEDLSEYLKERKIKAEYLHSDIKTIERIEILTEFRRGKFDVLVGVNLLREGLDLPEVAFIGILDADKEGFLRSDTALIQIIGRAARNVDGRVTLYADSVTGSMQRAIDETNRRRAIQLEYNEKHGITPKTISKAIKDITDQIKSDHHEAVKTLLRVDEELYKKNPRKLIREKRRQMDGAVKVLDFETAAILRDEIRELERDRKK